MIPSASSLSRRRAIGLLTLSGVPLCLPSLARAFSDPEHQLRRALERVSLPGGASRLDLVKFNLLPGQTRVGMEAVVRMTWPPGTRQRGFRAESGQAEQALAALLEQIEAKFLSAF